MHRNPALEMHPVDFTNDPVLAGQNDNLVAINATLQIDLLGQCGSESLGHAPYSGTGGQSDFVRAANRSRGGKAFIVLPSTAKGDTISRIVPSLSPGTHVSTSKNDIHYVVTEYGVAQLRGKSAKQRAQELIAIAHTGFPGRADGAGAGVEAGVIRWSANAHQVSDRSRSASSIDFRRNATPLERIDQRRRVRPPAANVAASSRRRQLRSDHCLEQSLVARRNRDLRCETGTSPRTLTSVCS